MKLQQLLEQGKAIRAIGFDDAPFPKRRGGVVRVVGVVCARTRFEGMLWGSVRQDGWNSTAALSRLLLGSKFLAQVHLVLLDGLAFGGFNLVDLPLLAQRLSRPCVAVMRRPPDLAAVERALQRLPFATRRLALLRAAGSIYHRPPFTFQVQGAEPEVIGRALRQLTDTGAVPEALRLAHLIGAAVMQGQSSRRA